MNSTPNSSDIGHTTSAIPGAGVGDIITQVEEKMTALMAWHKTQSKQLEADRAAFDQEMMQRQAEAEQAKGDVDSQREAFSRKVEQFELDRQALKNTAQALKQEQASAVEVWDQITSIRKTSESLFEQIESHRTVLGRRAEIVMSQAQGGSPSATTETNHSDSPVIVIKNNSQSARSGKAKRKDKAQR